MDPVVRTVNRTLEAIPAVLTHVEIVEWYNESRVDLFSATAALGVNLPDSFDRPVTEPRDAWASVALLFALKNKIESGRVSELFSDRAKENLAAVLGACANAMVE